MILIIIIIILLLIIFYLTKSKENGNIIKIVTKDLPNDYSNFDNAIPEEIGNELEKELGDNKNIIIHSLKVTKTVFVNEKKVSEKVFDIPLNNPTKTNITIVKICPIVKKRLRII